LYEKNTKNINRGREGQGGIWREGTTVREEGEEGEEGGKDGGRRIVPGVGVGRLRA